MNIVIKKIATSISLFAIASALIIPSGTFAKENENNKGSHNATEKKERNEQRKEIKKADKFEKQCWRFFGRFGSGDDCRFPFGFWAKFHGKGTTTPPVADTVAPVVSNIKTEARATNAVIAWDTSERAYGTVYWSTTSGFSTTSTSKMSDGLKNNNRVVIKGLSATTTYYAVIESKDLAGNKSTSNQFSFTTKAPVITNPGDVIPPIISTIAGVTGTSTIQLGWHTNEPSTSKVYYATSSPIVKNSASTSIVESVTLVNNHTVSVTGLATSTNYHFIVESKDSAGNSRSSTEFLFRTNN